MTTLAELFDSLKHRIEVDPQTGTRKYYNAAGQLHRENGPAVEYDSDSKAWYQNDIRHREDGPAVILKTGSKLWFQNGELHRTDGPAVEWSDGGREWWIHGVQYTESEYCLQLKTLEHTCLLKQNYLKHSGTVLQCANALVYVDTTTIQANCTVKMDLL